MFSIQNSFTTSRQFGACIFSDFFEYGLGKVDSSLIDLFLHQEG